MEAFALRFLPRVKTKTMFLDGRRARSNRANVTSSPTPGYFDGLMLLLARRPVTLSPRPELAKGGNISL